LLSQKNKKGTQSDQHILVDEMIALSSHADFFPEVWLIRCLNIQVTSTTGSRFLFSPSNNASRLGSNG